jgi:hypothetical protein
MAGFLGAIFMFIFMRQMHVQSLIWRIAVERMWCEIRPGPGTDRSRAEKLWLVCGVMGDVMLCDRERAIQPSQKLYATIYSEKMT